MKNGPSKVLSQEIYRLEWKARQRKESAFPLGMKILDDRLQFGLYLSSLFLDSLRKRSFWIQIMQVELQNEKRKDRLLQYYISKTQKSEKMYIRARNFLAGGQSHNARFFKPYPFYAARARGKYIWDVDNNRYVDYWMGHTALILGHSPSIVVRDLVKQSANGLLFGAANKFAVELAELVSKCVP